jgi:hypothetical protein
MAAKAKITAMATPSMWSLASVENGLDDARSEVNWNFAASLMWLRNISQPLRVIYLQHMHKKIPTIATHTEFGPKLRIRELAIIIAE